MAKDRYKYFRIEAQELLQGLTEGLLRLDEARAPELMSLLLRHAHTFKGAARVVKRPDIAEHAHHLEDLLTAFRDTNGIPLADTVDRGLSVLNQIKLLLASLSQGEEVTKAASAPGVDAPRLNDALSVSMADLDLVLEGAFEALTGVASLKRGISQVADELTAARRARTRLGDSEHAQEAASALDACLLRLEGIHRQLSTRALGTHNDLVELKQAISRMRLIPASALVTDLEQLTREVGRNLGRKVALEASGADIHLDAKMYAELRKALVHVVQNALAHGIEDEAARVSMGKDPCGRITLTFERRGGRVVVRCADDGRGVRIDAVRSSLVASGRLSPLEQGQLTDDEVLRLLLEGGVTTSEEVTGVAGRGVGLDAVRYAIESVRGFVQLSSDAGRGTTVSLDVPFSMAALPALSFEDAGRVYWVPFTCVRSVLSLDAADLEREDQRRYVMVDGARVPVESLDAVVYGARTHVPERTTVVVIEANGSLAGLGVGRVGQPGDIVSYAVPRHCGADDCVSGATLDAEGLPELLLSPEVLVERVRAQRTHSLKLPEKQEPRLPILVIDDSLTTRMLEQSILESAGYEVDLATSGEEGLRLARQKGYGVFVVDVEMPHMSGFEFVEMTRKDPALRRVPAILVTSLDAPDDI